MVNLGIELFKYCPIHVACVFREDEKGDIIFNNR
jgi:hypothetical protein